jgi:formylglycine-generating enzyme required for sulfatase activity
MLVRLTPPLKIDGNLVEQYTGSGVFYHKNLAGVNFFSKDGESIYPTNLFYHSKDWMSILGVSTNSSYSNLKISTYHSMYPENRNFNNISKSVSNEKDAIFVADEGNRSVEELSVDFSDGSLTSANVYDVNYDIKSLAYYEDEANNSFLVFLDQKKKSLSKFELASKTVSLERQNYIFRTFIDICTGWTKTTSAIGIRNEYIYAINLNTIFKIDVKNLSIVKYMHLENIKAAYIEFAPLENLIITDTLNNTIHVFDSENLNKTWSSGGSIVFKKPERPVVYKHLVIIPQNFDGENGWEAFQIAGFLDQEPEISNLVLTEDNYEEGETLEGSFDVSGRSIVRIYTSNSGGEALREERLITEAGSYSFSFENLPGIQGEWNVRVEATSINGWADSEIGSFILERQNLPILITGGQYRGTLIDDFLMDKFEVSVSDYWAMTWGLWNSSRLPMISVDRTYAVNYLNGRSLAEGLEPVYYPRCVLNNSEENSNQLETCLSIQMEPDYSKNGYRLPTREEWQYAFAEGDEKKMYYWNEGDVNIATWNFENSEDRIHESGQKDANAFGLFDMAGNAFELIENYEPRLIAPSYTPVPFSYYTSILTTLEFWDDHLLRSMGGSFKTMGASLNVDSERKVAQRNLPEASGFRAVRNVEPPRKIVNDVQVVNKSTFAGDEFVFSVSLLEKCRLVFWFESPLGNKFRIPIQENTEFSQGRHTFSWAKLPFIPGNWKLIVHARRSTPLPEEVVFTVSPNDANQFSRVEGGIYNDVQIDPMLAEKYEVTQQDYLAIMGRNPSVDAAVSVKDGLLRPVNKVTLYDAMIYSNLKSLHEGLVPVYTGIGCVTWNLYKDRCLEINDVEVNPGANGYRLPTKEEWEFLYGAEEGEDYYWKGAREDEQLASDYAWFGGPLNTTMPVGNKNANKYGLYDLSGNAYEWVFEEEGTLKGGALYSNLKFLRVGYDHIREKTTAGIFGFRVIRSAEPEPSYYLHISGCQDEPSFNCSTGWHEQGDNISISVPQEYQGMRFVRWIGPDGLVPSVESTSIEFNMPSETVRLFAVYEAISNVTVLNGSGTGNYDSGDEVQIVANSPSDGMQFSHWSGSVEHFNETSDVYNSEVTFLFPNFSGDVILEANYVAQPCNLIVNNGTGGGVYSNEIFPQIEAIVPEGYLFSHWSGDIGYVEDASSTVTNVHLVGGQTIQLTAEFLLEDDAVETVVSIFNGSGSGTYSLNSEIRITANSASNGFEFDHWETVSGSRDFLQDYLSPSTVLLVGSDSLHYSAVYREITDSIPSYRLIIGTENHYNDPSHQSTIWEYYTEGAQVELQLYFAPSGMVFSYWQGDVQYLSDSTNVNAVLTMPGRNVVFYPVFEVVGENDDLDISMNGNSTDIWGFESVDDWDSPAQLSITTHNTQGNAAVILNQTGYNVLQSDDFLTSELSLISNTISLDYMFPSMPSNPDWLGTVQFCLIVETNAVNICSNEREFPLNVGLGEYATISFPVTQEQMRFFGYANVNISAVLILNTSETITLDNMRFTGRLNTNNSSSYAYECMQAGCSPENAIDLGIEHYENQINARGDVWLKISQFPTNWVPESIVLETRPTDGMELTGQVSINGSYSDLGGWYTHTSFYYCKESVILIKLSNNGEREYLIKWWGQTATGSELNSYLSTDSTENGSVVLQNFETLCTDKNSIDLGAMNTQSQVEIDGLRCFKISQFPEWADGNSIYLGMSSVGGVRFDLSMNFNGAQLEIDGWYGEKSWKFLSESDAVVFIGLYSNNTINLSINWWMAPPNGSEVNETWEFAYNKASTRNKYILANLWLIKKLEIKSEFL